MREYTSKEMKLLKANPYAIYPSKVTLSLCGFLVENRE